MSSKACAGGLILPGQTSDALCATGYGGNLCQVCQMVEGEKFAMISFNTCGQCPTQGFNILMLQAILLILVFLTSIIVLNIRTRRTSEIAIIMRIMTNFLQIMSSTSLLNLNWPYQLQGFFTPFSYLGDSVQNVIYFDCFLKSPIIPNAEQSFIYFKTIMTCIIPIILILAYSGGFWLILKFKSKLKDQLVNWIILMSVIVIYFTQPTVTRAIISLLYCIQIDDGEYWLQSDLSIKCWEGDHLRLSIAITIPFTAIWVVGLPLATFLYLRRNRFKLGSLDFMTRFKTLCQGLKTDHYYWEFVNICRKLFLVFINVFLQTQISLFKAMVSLLVLGVIYRLQCKVSPYRNDMMNELERREMVASLVCFYGSLFFLNAEIQDSVRLITLSVIIVFILWFLGLWLYLVVQSFKNKCCFRLANILRYITFTQVAKIHVKDRLAFDSNLQWQKWELEDQRSRESESNLQFSIFKMFSQRGKHNDSANVIGSAKSSPSKTVKDADGHVVHSILKQNENIDSPILHSKGQNAYYVNSDSLDESLPQKVSYAAMNKYAVKQCRDSATPILEESMTPRKKAFQNNYKGKTQDEIFQSLKSLEGVFKKERKERTKLQNKQETGRNVSMLDEGISKVIQSQLHQLRLSKGKRIKKRDPKGVVEQVFQDQRKLDRSRNRSKNAVEESVATGNSEEQKDELNIMFGFKQGHHANDLEDKLNSKIRAQQEVTSSNSSRITMGMLAEQEDKHRQNAREDERNKNWSVASSQKMSRAELIKEQENLPEEFHIRDIEPIQAIIIGAESMTESELQRNQSRREEEAKQINKTNHIEGKRQSIINRNIRESQNQQRVSFYPELEQGTEFEDQQELVDKISVTNKGKAKRLTFEESPASSYKPSTFKRSSQNSNKRKQDGERIVSTNSREILQKESRPKRFQKDKQDVIIPEDKIAQYELPLGIQSRPKTAEHDYSSNRQNQHGFEDSQQLFLLPQMNQDPNFDSNQQSKQDKARPQTSVARSYIKTAQRLSQLQKVRDEQQNEQNLADYDDDSSLGFSKLQEIRFSRQDEYKPLPQKYTLDQERRQKMKFLKQGLKDRTQEKDMKKRGRPKSGFVNTNQLSLNEMPAEKVDFHNASGLNFLKWVAKKEKRQNIKMIRDILEKRISKEKQSLEGQAIINELDTTVNIKTQKKRRKAGAMSSLSKSRQQDKSFQEDLN